MPFFISSQIVLGLACVFLRGLPASQRAAGLRFLAVLGGVSSVVLFLTRDVGSSWSTMEFAPERSGLVAVATFCSWLLVIATSDGAGARWDLGALVSAAATALAVLASSRWVVPVLLFWIALSAASLVSSWKGSGAHLALVTALADACFIVGLTGHAVATESWDLPAGLAGEWSYPLIAAIVLRAGVIPMTGLGGILGRPEGATAPLLVGSAFAVTPIVSSGDGIAVALPLLLLAAGAVAWCLVTDKPVLSVLAVWPVAAMLAIVWIDRAALGKGAATAAIAVALLSLWPFASGRAQSERGLILAALPATIGFGAIVAGAGASFDRAIGATSVVAAAPWDAFAALLPVVLAGGVALAATIGKRVELEDFRPEGVLATWALAAAAVATGLSPGPGLGFGSGTGSQNRAVWLFAIAILVGVAATRLAPRGIVPLTSPRPAPSPGVIDLAPGVSKLIARVSAGVFALGAGVVGWLTYQGLSVGFL